MVPKTMGVKILLMVLAGLLAGTGATLAGQKLRPTNYGEMEPVVFDHTKHAEDVGCPGCHHPERSEGSHRCGGCHLAEERSGYLSLEDAAHKEGVGKCWSCHLKERARHALECEDCHRG